MFDDDFDTEDATIIGGIMGFAEESMREENRQPEDIEEEPDLEGVGPTNTTMRLLKSENPGLFAYVAKKVIEHKKKWSEYKRQRSQDMSDIDSVRHELEAMERTEHLLEEDNEV